MIRRLILALALLMAAPFSAEAATRTCSAAYTAACDTAGVGGGTYCDFADTDTWGAAAPGASDVAVISGSCKVRMTASTTNQAVRITSADAELQVYVGAATTPITYTLSTCNTSDATSFTYGDSGLECGSTAGTVKLTGTVIYDSRTNANADISNFAGGTSVASAGAQLRWFWLNSGEQVFKVGDIVHVTSGPQRNLVYKIANVGGGFMDVALYDPTMVYTTNKPNAIVNQVFADNNGAALPLVERIRIASPANASYEANDLDRFVTLCLDNGGTTTACPTATTIAANDILAGWYLFLESGGRYGQGVSTNPRFLIKDTQNNVATPITGDTDSPDLIELAEPLSAAVLTSSSTLDQTMVIAPGFCPLCGDKFVVYRPARIAYSGSNGDAGLRFWDSTLVFNYFDIEDFAVVAISDSVATGPTGYPSLSWGRVVPFCQGVNTAINYNGALGCNTGAIDLSYYEDFSFDHVFIGDTRTPNDTSASNCVGTAQCAADAGAGGCNLTHGAACATATGFLFDAATVSGHHGLIIGGNTNFGSATLNDTGCRYLGDDCIVSNGTSLATASTLNITGLTCWQEAMLGAASANCFDTGTANPPQLTNYNIRNMIAVNWNDPGYQAVTNSVGVRSTVSIDNAFMLDPTGNSQVLTSSAPASGELWTPSEAKVSNVLAIVSGSSDNTAVTGASAIGNWFDGYRGITSGGSNVSRNYLRSQNTTSANSLFGYSSTNDPITIQDNIVVGAGAIVSVSPGNGHSRIIAKNNAISFSTFSSQSFGSYTSGYSPLTFSGNIIRNGTFFNCGDSTWGAANLATLGYNVAVVPTAVPINSGSNCTTARARQFVMVDTPTFYNSWLVPQQLAGGATGPQSRVGVNSWARTEMGLQRSYTFQGGNGAGGGGNRACIGVDCASHIGGN